MTLLRRFRVAAMTAVGACLLTTVAGLVAPAAAQAASTGATHFVASTGTDVGLCMSTAPCRTVSYAVAVSSANDTVDVAAGTFLDHVLIPTYLTGFTIRGAGAGLTTVSGGFSASGSVFFVYGGASVTIADLSVIGGVAPNGGGIDNQGTLSVLRDTIAFNAANDPSLGSGGGVWTEYGGRVSVVDSSIIGNTATVFGGGIGTHVYGTITGTLIARNTVTLSDPQSSGGGGGVFGSFMLTDDTVVANKVIDSSGHPTGRGGGVFFNTAAGVLDFSTLADNTAAYGAGLFASESHIGRSVVAGNVGGPICMGLTFSTGYVLEDDSAGTCDRVRRPGDVAGADPKLGPLADNGGPTQTMALLPGSPAMGAVPAADCGSVDQRGFPRWAAARGVCDVGAYDSGAAAPAPPTIGTATPGAASASITFTAPSADGGAPVTAYTVTASPGGQSATGTTSPITVGALTPGTSYTFTVTAANAVGRSPASEPSNAVIPIMPVQVATTTLPPATVGVPYSATLQATGGTAPYSWSLTGTTPLQPGLRLNSDGTITGTPTSAVARSVGVQVADAGRPQLTAAATLVLQVLPMAADLSVSLVHIGSAIPGHAARQTATARNTGAGTTTGATTVTITVATGLTPRSAAGTGWVCIRSGQIWTCVHAGALQAGSTSTVNLTSYDWAKVGTTLISTGRVAPTDATPGDNAATDTLVVQRT